jgi:hypothetical protein
MNENQLRSWRPRQPSAALKRRLFHLADDAEIVPQARWLWSCLAPTLACALLTLFVLNHDGDGLPSALPMTAILSSQDNAAFASGGATTTQNHLAAVTFDSTNGSIFQSSMRFTPLTNLTN